MQIYLGIIREISIKYLWYIWISVKYLDIHEISRKYPRNIRIYPLNIQITKKCQDIREVSGYPGNSQISKKYLDISRYIQTNIWLYMEKMMKFLIITNHGEISKKLKVWTMVKYAKIEKSGQKRKERTTE